MNTLLLWLGLRPWAAASACDQFTRVFAAISLFSIEMQIATWIGAGSLATLVPVNAAAALGLALATRGLRVGPLPAPGRPTWPPPVALLAMAALVLVLNVTLPFEAADPYHLEKMDWIGTTGSLAYNPAAETKVNVLNPLYELWLADLHAVPVAGPALVRLHGVFGLGLYVLSIACVGELLRAAPGRGWAVLLVVPVVFHELVLVKNDLFGGAPALVALAWAVARAGTGPPREVAWACWLAGLAVGVKLTTLPLLPIVAGAILVTRPTWDRVATAAAAGIAGMVAAGFALTLTQNLQMYGSLMPVGEQGNVNVGPAAAVIGLLRFGISLFDLGLLTRVWWPGRGGWGGTFGLPLLWGLAVVIASARRAPLARVVLLCTALYVTAFALIFADADVAHRLVLPPALLLIAYAVTLVEQDRSPAPRAFRAAMIAVVVLSSAQILRSALLYYARAQP
jgi:hypothetical protein